jgi:alpha-galactosidase
MKISKNDFNRLIKSGWQSWSFKSKNYFKIPSLNFNPKGKHYSNLNTHILKSKSPAYGWCSWYAFGPDINEEKILSQAKWIFENKKINTLPLEYILIDGGWSTWGDWLKEDPTKFPLGIKHLVSKIKNYGLKSGIWIAPFLVDQYSVIAKDHDDWLVKSNGEKVEGLNLTPIDKFMPYKKWILDIKNPKVVKYLDDSIDHLITNFGVKLIKFDFLYAIYFDPNITANEADNFLHSFLKKVRDKYPDVYTIACGCPLIPAVGAVDSMRIGPDTSIAPFVKLIPFSFISNLYLKYIVIPTVLNRLWTKKYWNVDPDAFICNNASGFSDKQLFRLQKTIKKGNGNIFLGDDLTTLTSNEISKYINPLFIK